ncbi:MAG: Diaminopimelate decarboxylase [Candidatus Ordinivivax streblomastigis]|uniref:Diaminopimelate decarboxylase n=1 Tax=Candidatus Ordinivivax streblomastigis TaxID=2540710 RepID=A0A5M8NV34_9BACT|nr:MAG: Diaminopimelate decarboxylase [Candidatus Ordinivivax streblomastigis]KAA6300722.1 MAG: Diaminopimelate decarboxylase [Candidatus Ordinivivax streblomastigis]
MTKGIFPVTKFQVLQTPFYYYNTTLLRETLQIIVAEASKYHYHIHYAVKANANPRILSIINEYGLGVDCVSGGEIQAALNAGFPAEKIVFAGVGKADWEIELGLDNRIFCFNTESIPELEVIHALAAKKGQTAQVALRINPEIDAHTHHHITTGTKENKFGINLDQLDKVLDRLSALTSVRLIGLHFHIGSQLTDLNPFKVLCERVAELQQQLAKRNIQVENINFGGGLGIDYENPDGKPIPDFKHYFEIFHTHFPALPHQQIHFEPGRSVVGQCGSLISKVLYVKEGSVKKFAILDAGFTELIRPALYDAYHKIENLSSDEVGETYDVVGPICESSDCFAKQIELNKTHRGDWIALRSAGAYGEIMASQYNCRQLPESYFSDRL